MASPTQTQYVTDLFHHAEERAERLIAVLRLFIAGTLTFLIVFLISQMETELGPALQRQVSEPTCTD